MLLAAVGAIRAVGDDAQVALAIAAAACLLAWYAAGALVPALRDQAGERHWWLAGLTVLWLAAVAVSPEFVWIAFLLWLVAGQLLPGWVAVGYSLAVFAVVVLAPVVHHGATTYAGVIGPLIGGLFALGISRGYLRLLADAAEREGLVASLTQAQQETSDLHDELVITQRHAGAMAERNRLAGDIHDTVAQSMASIRLLAHAAGEPGPGDPRETLRQVESLAADGLRDIRRIIAALAPAELEDGALPAALTRMTQRLANQSGIRADLHIDASIGPLTATLEVALLRVAQSALANVRLHSRAGRVTVSLLDDDDEIRLDIIDDGRGFATTARGGPQPVGRTGYGLGLMRTRLRALGGDLEVTSTPGEGTALSAHLPIHQRTEQTP